MGLRRRLFDLREDVNHDDMTVVGYMAADGVLCPYESDFYGYDSYEYYRSKGMCAGFDAYRGLNDGDIPD
jgi:hypothetical protein